MIDILFAQIALSAIFGLATGLTASLTLTDRENSWFSLICSLLGATVGVWFSVIWIFITGGTTFSALMLFSVVITTVIVLMLVLGSIREVTRSIVPVGKLSTLLSFSIIVLIAFFLLVSVIPIHSSSINTTSLLGANYHNADFLASYPITDTLLSELQSTSDFSSVVPLSISVQKASVNFPYFSTDPKVGDYLGFDVTFNVGSGGGDWNKPYIKMAILQDTDNSGDISDDDAIWGNSVMKGAITSELWRSQCLYNGTTPLVQMTMLQTSDGFIFMPIFYGQEITTWQNDVGKKFTANTPEGYTPQTDQMSWQLDGDYIYSKEDLTAFATISKGSSVEFKGKIYCHEQLAGKNFLWIGAYDLDFQKTPYETGFGSPLAQKTYAFTISGGGSGPTVDADGPYSGSVGQTITFTGSATGGTTPYTEWKWTFSDGTTKYGQSVSRSFSSAGTYTASLQVTDSAGKVGSDSADVTIGGGGSGPTVDAGGPYSGSVGQIITFTGSATGGTTPYTEWKWTFSDGTTKYGQSVSRSFSSAGTYTASLQVTDNADKIGSDSASITIGGGGPDIEIDIATYVIGGTLTLGSLGAVVYGRKFL